MGNIRDINTTCGYIRRDQITELSASECVHYFDPLILLHTTMDTICWVVKISHNPEQFIHILLRTAEHNAAIRIFHNEQNDLDEMATVRFAAKAGRAN